MPLKLKLIKDEGEIRRFSLSDERMRSFSLQSLHEVVHNTFPSLTVYNLYYFENGLFVEISTANDWESALRYAHLLGTHPLAIHISTDIEQVRMAMFAPSRVAQQPPAPASPMPQLPSSSIPVLGESPASSGAPAEESLEQRFFKFIESIPVVLSDGAKEVQKMVETVGRSAEEALAEKKIAESLNHEAEEIKAHVDTFVDQVKLSVDQVKEQVEQLLARDPAASPAVVVEDEEWEDISAAVPPVSSQAPPSDNRVRHPASCDMCEETIFGVRYKCAMCSDYDLCEVCEAKEAHTEGHLFLKMNKPEFVRGFVPLGQEMAPISDLDCKFVRDFTYPDGTVVQAGSNFDKSWVIKNNSDKAWPAGTFVKHVGGTALPLLMGGNVPAAKPGEEVTVTVTVKAPATAGKVSGYFRLYHPIGQVGFGDRLWLDVVVDQPFPFAEALAQLSAMGFEEEVCRALLEEYNGDILRVIDQIAGAQ